jgi:ADP-heptose:LPS heptosyltransferase
VELEARMQTLPEFRQRLTARLERMQSSPERGRVVIHPGATDPRRRWPAERFGAVARMAADDGFRVLVIGDHSEKELAEAVVEHAVGRGAPDDAPETRPQVESLAGQLGLGELAALLADCSVVVANDSGPRHLAQALGAPTVGVFWTGNAINAGPLGRSLHRIHLGWTTRCGVCGVDVTQVGWTAPRCPHDESTVEAVAPEAVYEDVLQLTAMSLPPRGR